MTLFLSCTWAVLSILCASLGFMVNPTGGVKVALVIISVLCFVPGAMLLAEGYRKESRKTVVTVRWICLVSLILTVIFLVVFFLCAAFASEAVVNVIFVILTLVSTPMLCSQYWALSLFLWGCLLSATFLKKLPR